jgi:lysophospholipase L1-like esterase
MSSEKTVSTSAVLARRPLGLKRKFLFAFVAVVGFLCLIEAALRIVSVWRPFTRHGYHQRLAVDLGFADFNRVLEPDRHLFWRLRPSLPPTWIEGRIGSADLAFTLSTTEEGLRTMPKASDARQTVVCLGDSCTFGIGVDDDETYPARLQELLPGVQCLNAGVPGYSAFQGRQWLEANIDRWSPAVVIISFGFNDASGWDRLSDAQHAEALSTRGLGPLEHLSVIQMMRLAAAGRRANQGRGARLTATEEEFRPRLTPTEFGDELVGIIRLCRSVGAAPILMAWPDRFQIEGLRPPYPHHEVIRTTAAVMDVATVDLFGLLGSNGGPAYYADVVHVNRQGARVVSRAVHNVVRRAFGKSSGDLTGDDEQIDETR